MVETKQGSRMGGALLWTAAGVILVALVALAILVLGGPRRQRPPRGAAPAKAQGGVTVGPPGSAVRHGDRAVRPEDGAGAAVPAAAGGDQAGEPRVRDHRGQGDGTGRPDPVAAALSTNFLASGKPVVTACARELLARKPHAKGAINVVFTVREANGVLTANDVEVGGASLGDEAFVGCVTRGFAALTPPVPEGGTPERRMSVPFFVP